MHSGFQSKADFYRGVNKITPLSYADGRATYARYLRFHEPNQILENQLSLLRLNELTVNDKFALPYCHLSCAAIDETEIKFMTVGASNGDVYVINLDQAEDGDKNAIAQYKKRPVTSDGHSKRVLGCEWFKNDAASFITCARDNTVKLWDTANFEVVDTYKMDYDGHSITQIDWNDVDPHLIAVALGSSVVKFVDSAVGSSVQQIRWKSKHISTLKWYPQNGYFIFVGTTEGAAAFFDIRQSKAPFCELRDRKFSAFDSKVEKAKFTADGTTVVACSSDMMLKGFDMNDGQVVYKLRPGQGPKKPTSPIFDLCEEGNEVFAVVPCKRKVKLTRLQHAKEFEAQRNDRDSVDSFYDEEEVDQPCISSISPLSRLKNFKIDEDILLDGFLGDSMGVVYRSNRQHIIGYGTTESALIFTPRSEISTLVPGPCASESANLHADDWSSDEGF